VPICLRSSRTRFFPTARQNTHFGECRQGTSLTTSKWITRTRRSSFAQKSRLRRTRTGLRRWLYALGVRHFTTQEPSDLEYDPQLAVVAEWRDPDSLWQDHVDNAVIDAMLEGADAGDDLSYPWYQLAAARLLKVYSAIRTLLGGRGSIPEGMAADTALRVRVFSARHARIAEELYGDAVQFERERGYRPPYWVLVQLAREQLN